jgi:hypothetical protein
MGKPAARLGDLTAHGGTVTLGDPTIMMGKMPARKIVSPPYLDSQGNIWLGLANQSETLLKVALVP